MVLIVVVLVLHPPVPARRSEDERTA
jgi:hypothetical protein